MNQEANFFDFVKNQKAYFNTDVTKPLLFRINQLKKLKKLIRQYENQMLDALANDLGRPLLESYIAETLLLLNDINYCIKKLKTWTKPKYIKNDFFLSPSRSKIHYEPLGVSLIISPWSFPLLAIRPLIAAISAGNCITLKCSEHASFSHKVISEMINQNFPKEYIYVLDSKIDPQKLIQANYDFILYADDPNNAKSVMRMAADTLSPICFILKGINPVIIDETANLAQAAKKVVTAKYLNSAQTYLAPDLICVHVSLKDKLVCELQKQIMKFYGETPTQNPDYGRIINKMHFNKLVQLLNEQNILFGGSVDETHLKIEPTLIERTFENDNFSQETFGPILHIITYKDLDLLIAQLKKLPRLHALYHFSKHKASILKVNNSLIFKEGSINDCLTHTSNLGTNGLGTYAGEQGFKAFSLTKSIIERRNITLSNFLPLTPKYTTGKFKFFRSFAKLMGYG